MNWKIVFTSGCNTGKTVVLAPGFSVKIGRSHVCDVKCTEGDVSGRHVELSVNAEGFVHLFVESRHRTVRNGSTLKCGDEVILSAGDIITLGKAVIFELRGDTVDFDEANTIVGDDAIEAGFAENTQTVVG